MKYVYLYILTFIVFLAIDFIWLNWIAKNLYSQKIGHLLAENPNLIAAGVFYLLFVGASLVLAVLPGYEAQSLTKTILLGAIFGMITYATYDLTNLATLKEWPLSVTIIDIIWGTSLSTATAVAGYYIANFLNI
ncbi:MAG: DUF2177 family protein [Candidatus Dojkabacteria bacterium]